jgi:hypothetical protein
MADTTDFMILGYAVAFLILAVTIGSVWLRYRQAYRDLALVDQLAAEENVSFDEFGTDTTPVTAATSQPKPTLAADEL